MYLFSSSLTRIEEHVLEDLSGLQRLDLSSNQIEIIGHPSSFFDRQFTTATAFLPNFKSSGRLRHVDLSRNNIKHISDDQLYGLKFVQHLNLSVNNIPFIHSGYQWLMGIKTFDASFNRLTYIDQAFGQYQMVAEDINLSHNYLKQISKFSKVSCWNLQTLDLGFNEIESISNAGIQNCLNLENFKAHGNRMKVIKRDDFMHFPRLQNLHLGQNAIVEIEGYSFQQNSELNSLDMSVNALKKLDDFTLAGLLMLRIVNFAKNEIEIISNNTFSNCRLLQYIFLTDNKISFVPPSSFLSLTQLRLVSLKNNRISLPHVDWFYSFSGEYHVDDETGLVLEKKHLLTATINLEENPWTCNCKMSNFANWIRSMNENSSRLGIECIFPRYFRHLKLATISHADLQCSWLFDFKAYTHFYSTYIVISVLLMIAIFWCKIRNASYR